MTLNGWRRLWIVTASAWGLTVLVLTASSLYVWVYDFDRRSNRFNLCTLPDMTLLQRFSECYPKTAIVSGGLVIWVVPALFVYAIGAGIAWVRQGFQHDDPE